jgi:hypothetical protein
MLLIVFVSSEENRVCYNGTLPLEGYPKCDPLGDFSKNYTDIFCCTTWSDNYSSQSPICRRLEGTDDLETITPCSAVTFLPDTWPNFPSCQGPGSSCFTWKDITGVLAADSSYKFYRNIIETVSALYNPVYTLNNTYNYTTFSVAYTFDSQYVPWYTYPSGPLVQGETNAILICLYGGYGDEDIFDCSSDNTLYADFLIVLYNNDSYVLNCSMINPSSSLSVCVDWACYATPHALNTPAFLNHTYEASNFGKYMSVINNVLVFSINITFLENNLPLIMTNYYGGADISIAGALDLNYGYIIGPFPVSGGCSSVIDPYGLEQTTIYTTFTCTSTIYDVSSCLDRCLHQNELKVVSCGGDTSFCQLLNEVAYYPCAPSPVACNCTSINITSSDVYVDKYGNTASMCNPMTITLYDQWERDDDISFSCPNIKYISNSVLKVHNKNMFDLTCEVRKFNGLLNDTFLFKANSYTERKLKRDFSIIPGYINVTCFSLHEGHDCDYSFYSECKKYCPTHSFFTLAWWFDFSCRTPDQNVRYVSLFLVVAIILVCIVIAYKSNTRPFLIKVLKIVFNLLMFLPYLFFALFNKGPLKRMRVMEYLRKMILFPMYCILWLLVPRSELEIQEHDIDIKKMKEGSSGTQSRKLGDIDLNQKPSSNLSGSRNNMFAHLHIIVTAVILFLPLCFAGSECYTDTVITSQLTSCSISSDGIKTCMLSYQSSFPLSKSTGSICLDVVEPNDRKLVLQYKFEMPVFETYVDLNSLYYTRDWELETNYHDRCPSLGSTPCAISGCLNINQDQNCSVSYGTTVKESQIVGASTEYPGFCGCVRSTSQDFFKNCGIFVGAKCLIYRWSLRPVGPTYKVFKVGHLSTKPVITVTSIDTFGNVLNYTVQKSGNKYYLNSNKTISFSLSGDIPPKNTFLTTQCIVSNSFHNAFYSDCSDRNTFSSGLLGDIQSDSNISISKPTYNSFNLGLNLVSASSNSKDQVVFTKPISGVKNAIKNGIKFPVRNGGWDWFYNSGRIFTNDNTDSEITVHFKTEKPVQVVFQEQNVCPEGKLLEVGGFLDSTIGSVAIVELKSSCTSGFVNLRSDDGSISIKTKSFTISNDFRKYEIHFSTTNSFNDFSLFISGTNVELELKIEFNAKEDIPLIDLGTNDEIDDKPLKSDTNSWWDTFVNGILGGSILSGLFSYGLIIIVLLIIVGILGAIAKIRMMKTVKELKSK